MITVFQNETGGVVSFSINTAIPAVSGYVDVVKPARVVMRLDGVVVSGELTVTKSGISSGLTPGYYTLLPQVLDDLSKRYFLGAYDLQIIESPE